MLKRLILIVLTVLCINGCSVGKLDGIYLANDGHNGMVIFKEDTISIGRSGLSIDGTYEIHDDTLTISYKIFGLGVYRDYTFERRGNTVVIDGKEYTKE